MKRIIAKRYFAVMLSASLALSLFPSASFADAVPNVAANTNKFVWSGPDKAVQAQAAGQTGQRIIVKYKPNANLARLKTASSAVETDTVSRFNMEVMQLAAGVDVNAVLSKLKSNPDVVYAEPDVRILKHASPPQKQETVVAGGAESAPKDKLNSISTGQGQAGSSSSLPDAVQKLSVNDVNPITPNDELYSSQWGLNNVGQSIDESYGSYNVDIDAPEAWSITQGSQEELVALLDTGVDINHPDLAANVWRNPNEIPGNGIDDDGDGFVDDFYGWNFYENNNEPYSMYDDDFYGTQVAGIIAASNNNDTGISGVAPNVRYMPLKIMGNDGGYVSDAIRAIDYAERKGAKIANISWSMETYSNALKDAIDSSKMLFVASAGQDYVNGNKDKHPEYPAAYDSDNILSVAGLDMYGSFNNTYGFKTVDISAPSAKVITTMPTRDPGVGAEVDTGTYKVIYNELGYEGMWNDDGSKFESYLDGFKNAFSFLGKSGGSPSSVLLVNDEEISENSGYSMLSFYKKLLGAVGATFDTVKVQPGEDGPSKEQMNQYDMVIWFTGYAVGSSPDGKPTTVLRTLDQSNLSAYLNQGGHLMLSGAGTLTNIEYSDFVRKMLHLDFVRYDFFRGSGDISRWSSAAGQPGTAYEGRNYDHIATFSFLADYESNDPSVTHMNLRVPMKDYDYDNGTYLAPAFASGVAALVLSVDPTLDALALKERVMLSGKHLESLYSKDGQAYLNNGKMVDAYRAISDDDAPGKTLKAEQTKLFDPASGDLQDVYYVHLNAGDKLNLSLTGEAGANFAMELYNSDLTSLTDWDKEDKKLGSALASGEPAALEYKADKEGYYYVVVYFIGSTTPYTLTMNKDTVNTEGTYEDSNAALVFEGPWAEKAQASYSGGTIKTLDAAGKVKFAFTGSLVELTALKDDTMGIADVYLDGVKVASPSLYSKTSQAKQSIFKQSLKYGYHTVELVWTGRSDPAAKRSVHAINLDSIIVGTGEGFYTTLAEESDGAFSYSGMWSLESNVNYSGGYVKATAKAGDYAEFTFTGTKAVLLAATTASSGQVTVIVDNKPESVKTVDLYSEGTRYQVPVFDTGTLSYGPHSIRVINVHKKNAKSSGYSTNIDAVVVTKPSDGTSLKVYQDSNPFVSFTGVWTVNLSSRNSGNSSKYSEAVGNTAKLTFLGTKVTLLSQTGPNRGKVDIYIDGVKVNGQPVDLYAAQYQSQVPVFESGTLPYGSHEVKVVNKAEKNEQSSGHVISIDAFYVMK